jgi:hypothetical protein
MHYSMVGGRIHGGGGIHSEKAECTIPWWVAESSGRIHSEAECTIPWWVAESMAVAESIVRRQNAQFHGGVAEFIG